MTPFGRKMKGCDRGSRESKRHSTVKTFMRKGTGPGGRTATARPQKERAPTRTSGGNFSPGRPGRDVSKIRQITSSPSPITYWQPSCRATGIIPRWTSTMALQTRTNTSTHISQLTLFTTDGYIYCKVFPSSLRDGAQLVYPLIPRVDRLFRDLEG